MEELRWRLSRHSIERLYERFPAYFTDEAKATYRRGDYWPLLKETFTMMNAAEVREAVHNNTAFMLYIGEKYGFQRYRFLVYRDILFVGIERHDVNQLLIVTVMDLRKGPTWTHQTLGTRKKFKKVTND